MENIENKHSCTHTNRPLKMSDDVTVEFIKSTQWPPNSADLNPLHYHVWNEFKRLAYKNQRETFPPLKLLQKKSIEDVWSHVPQDGRSLNRRPLEMTDSNFDARKPRPYSI